MNTDRPDLSVAAPVSLTPEAAHRLRQLPGAAGDTPRILRIRVEPGGCLGLRYAVTLDDPDGRGSEDTVVESHGVQIRMAPDAEPHLRGAVIDFDRSGFSVRSTSARGACACGASFAGPMPPT